MRLRVLAAPAPLANLPPPADGRAYQLLDLVAEKSLLDTLVKQL